MTSETDKVFGSQASSSTADEQELQSMQDQWLDMGYMPCSARPFYSTETNNGLSEGSEIIPTTFLELINHVSRGDLTATTDFLNQNPSAINAKISHIGETALHLAAAAGKVEIVKMLVGKMTREALEIKDHVGSTALAHASFMGIKEIVRCMIDKNRNLLSIQDKEGDIPLVCANFQNDEENVIPYLYSVTPSELLSPENGHNGPSFLLKCIIHQKFDIALDLLSKYPNLATAMHEGRNALMQLSDMPYAFESGTELIFWKRWIYSLSWKMHGLIIYLLEYFGIKQVYDMKHAHQRCMQILREVCDHVRKLDQSEYAEKGVYQSYENAFKNGVVEIVLEMVKVNHKLLYIAIGETSRDLFMSAIQYRQEKIFSLFYGLEANKRWFITRRDERDNTMLHMAGKLSPPNRLARISGAALQMQRELQWYKEVESILSPTLILAVNDDGKTAKELFSEEHKDLMIAGEKWMKETASSSTVVGALIITVMFAAAFTIPGGSIQDIGVPVFKHKTPFKAFIIADVISLFASSTSVLMFLGILTSRYAEEDFLISLPRKLIIGLSTLFISIAAMMVAFCATLILILDNQSGLIIPLTLLAGIPVTLFTLLQFPLLVKIFVSTYGPGMFKRKRERWY